MYKIERGTSTKKKKKSLGTDRKRPTLSLGEEGVFTKARYGGGVSVMRHCLLAERGKGPHWGELLIEFGWEEKASLL